MIAKVRIKKTLAWVLGTLVLFIGGTLIFDAVSWPERFEAYVVPSADFALPSFEESPSGIDYGIDYETIEKPVFYSGNHWIKKSDTRSMLLIRGYTPGRLDTSDDEHFTQISISISSLKMGSFKINSSDVRGYYTSGSSAWPGSQCGAEIKTGNLKIKSVSTENVIAEISIELPCKSKLRGRDIEFRQTLTFSTLDFDHTTTWTGRRGKSPYRETYSDHWKVF